MEIQKHTQILTQTHQIYTSGKTTAEETKPYYVVPTTLTHTAETSLDVQQTCYYFENTPASYFEDSEFHKLVFGTGTYYWLASRYANCGASYANFGLRFVNSTGLDCYALFHSAGTATYNDTFVRPVVSLGSDIQISATGGTADNPRTLSK